MSFQGNPQMPQVQAPAQAATQVQSPEMSELSKAIAELIASATDVALAFAEVDVDALKKIEGGEDLIEAIRSIVKATRTFQKIVRKMQSSAQPQTQAQKQ